MQVPYFFDNYSFVGSLIPSAPFFFLRKALAIQGLLCFQTNFKIFCSSSMKNGIDNLLGIALSLQSALSSMAILTILIVPIQGHLFISLKSD